VERVAWATANVSMTTVSWLVVTVTLARYCAICRPLDTLQIGRSKRVRKVGPDVSVYVVNERQLLIGVAEKWATYNQLASGTLVYSRT